MEKRTEEEQLDIARKYFYIGFAFLPFLWLVNFIQLYPLIKTGVPEIKKIAYSSLAGSIIYAVAFFAWLAVFLTQRVAWDEVADIISGSMHI
jgi:presenilin enhancer 2